MLWIPRPVLVVPYRITMYLHKELCLFSGIVIVWDCRVQQ